MDYSEHEKEVTDLLAIKMNTTVNIVSRVQFPLGISTPDYLIENKKWDLKTLTKDAINNTIFNRVQKAKRQVDNFIVDITNTKLEKNTVKEQVNKILRVKSINNVDTIAIKDKNEIQFFERNKKD